jgi:uncharacterized membrane protein
MPWSDERVEEIIGLLLRGGVTISAVTVLAGAIWYLAHSGSEPLDYRVFRGEPAGLRSIGGVVRGALDGHDTSLIQLGLLLLIATPVARVAFSIVAFALQRDRAYVVISLIVLVVLLYSLFLYGR